jgi:hypothetical protein
MKNIKWFVEKNLFPEYEDLMVKTIRNSGMTAYLFDDTDMNFNFYNYINKKLNDDDIVFFYGSLQNGRKMLKTKYYPGVYLSLDNYECYKYYGYFGEELLNSDYLLIGFNDILRKKDEIIDKYKTSFFIRPSNGFKSFPGQVINCNNFDSDYNALCKSYGGIDIDQLVLLSSCKNIHSESRYVIVDREIVDGCVYMINGEKIDYYQYDQGSYDYLNAILNKINYSPDIAYTIDISYNKDNDEYKVIEINSFCCAGLYNMKNFDKIINKLNGVILKDYNEIF